MTLRVSGTVGATTEVVEKTIPDTAFSDTIGSQTVWNTPVETYKTVYALQS